MNKSIAKNMNIHPVKRALLSVSNKENIIPFAQQLVAMNVEIISTGGTSQLLTQHAIPHRPVESLTALPEMLDGRVKTLHPKIHGGILAKRDKHQDELNQHQIPLIDLVAVNFYPFIQATAQADLSWPELVEYIDIGGPTMVRAAAKNCAWVTVVTDPGDYDAILTELKAAQGISWQTRQQLAKKAFALTTHYDSCIHAEFAKKTESNGLLPETIHQTYTKVADLRYGENPHQAASAYQSNESIGILAAKQWQGKALSYNNLLDADAALQCVREFNTPACVIVKHANPCGIATQANLLAAYEKALSADQQAAFGGIVALNGPCTEEIAQAILAVYTEIVIASSFTAAALAAFRAKPALRLLSLPDDIPHHATIEKRYLAGGLLVQATDTQVLQASDLSVVTDAKPQADEITTMLFAWQALKHVKSNAILIAKNQTSIGIGAGQVSRIDAVTIALAKAGEASRGAVLASDAFFPFRDNIDRIAPAGIKAIIQPGGSIRDEEVIAACNEHGIAMIFTGKRCFKH